MLGRHSIASLLRNLNTAIKSKTRNFSQTLRVTQQSSSNLEVSSPARAVLYVPASDVKKLAKIFTFNADCVVIDCEDGVALNRKEEARANIRNLFDTDERVRVDPDRKFVVRINPALTDLALQDINTIFSPKRELLTKQESAASFLPKCLFIPKTNSAEDIRWLYEKFENKLKDFNHTLSFYFYMESAMSLINLNDIIRTALTSSAEKYNNRFRLEGFVFGSDDFCADISITRTKDASELVYARQKLVTYCKAYKLKAIDMVYIDFKGKDFVQFFIEKVDFFLKFYHFLLNKTPDLEGLRLQSEQGARMGFTGKQVIHPMQVEVTQEAFSPSADKIKWACGLVEAFDKHQSFGAVCYPLSYFTVLFERLIIIFFQKGCFHVSRSND
jgi:citrate lyase subunit beta-like protein